MFSIFLAGCNTNESVQTNAFDSLDLDSVKEPTISNEFAESHEKVTVTDTDNQSFTPSIKSNAASLKNVITKILRKKDKSEQAEPLPIPQEPQESLRSYTSEDYFFTYKYPSNLKEWTTAPQGEFYSIISIGSKEIFRVSVKDPDLSLMTEKARLEFAEKAKVFNLSLKDYVKDVWNLNFEETKKDDKKVFSKIEETNFKNKEAYEFLINHNFVDQYNNWDLLEMTTVLYTKNDNKIFEFRFFTNDQRSKKILDSFEFYRKSEILPPDKQDNFASCNYITNLTDRDRCFSEYALKPGYAYGNVEACKEISDIDTKDSCYLKFALQIVYSRDPQIKADSELCTKISSGNKNAKSSCYWHFAMKTKDISLCKFISINEADSEITRSTCENELHYQYGNAKWKLTKGIPPYADSNALIYEGTAEIEGWIIEESPYDDNYLVKYFHVDPESLKFLPPAMQKHTNFNVEVYDKDSKYKFADSTVLSQLEAYSKQNPARIRINVIGVFYIENAPSIVLEKIID